MNGTESITLNLTNFSLDALWLRQKLIAQNVANQSTTGYQPLRLDFESQLHDLSGYLDANDSVGALAEMDRLRHTIVSRTDEGPVQIEREMADATLNGVRYQALLTALGRLTELNRLAISQEGR